MDNRATQPATRSSAADAKLDNLIDGVTALRVDLAEVKGQLKHLPTTLHLLGFAVGVFAAACLLRYFSS